MLNAGSIFQPTAQDYKNRDVMDITHILWKTNKLAIWNEISEKLNGVKINPETCISRGLTVEKNGLQIRLGLRWENLDGDERGTEITRISAPYKNITGFHCEIYKEGLFQSLGKMLGMQDIQIGSKEFDRQFIFKSNQPEVLRHILDDQELVEEISRHKNMRFMVKTENRFLGSFHPAGVDEICFEEEGVITDINRLESVFNLFSMFYEKMLSLGVANKKCP